MVFFPFQLPAGLSDALERHRPQAEAAMQRAAAKLEPLVAAAAPAAAAAADAVDGVLGGLRPWQIALLTVASVWLASVFSRVAASARVTLQKQGVVQLLFRAVVSLPGLRSWVAAEKLKAITKLQDDVRAETDYATDEPFMSLPEVGLPASKIKARLAEKQKRCMDVDDGKSRASGTVYIADKEHRELLKEAYGMFDLSNPMHASDFPTVRRMEAEVVAMTASMLGGGSEGVATVCGCMSSGGTESILLAMKASRDYMREVHGVTQPEMIIAVSAHAAYYKAAEYFGFKLVRVPVGPDYRLCARTVSRHMTRNTAVVVASAPGFPHGVVDHVTDIAAVTRRRGVLLHVDACLGGFVMPFARQLGYRTPAFDFSVPGVTSMSVDTHKFGMAHKGTSVVLYRWPALRRHQYTRITDWTGGLYISPGFAGSRNGALVVTAWTSMVHMGVQGYLQVTDAIMQAATKFTNCVRTLPELQLAGEPDSCVVALTAAPRTGLCVYKLNDLLRQRGWSLSALQGPPALHMCFTAQHVASVDTLIKDLRECVGVLKRDPSAAPDGMAPFYGLAAKLPDRSMVGQFLEAYQDALLSL